MLWIGNILGPELTLRPQDVLCLLRCEVSRDKIICVDFVNRQVATNSKLFCWIVRLVVIKVKVAIGSHNDIMIGLSRSDASLYAAPGYDRGSARYATFEDF